MLRPASCCFLDCLSTRQISQLERARHLNVSIGENQRLFEVVRGAEVSGVGRRVEREIRPQRQIDGVSRREHPTALRIQLRKKVQIFVTRCITRSLAVTKVAKTGVNISEISCSESLRRTFRAKLVPVPRMSASSSFTLKTEAENLNCAGFPGKNTRCESTTTSSKS